jgi:hypothetical protein
VIGTRDFDRARNRRSARCEQGRQKNRGSHVVNLWMRWCASSRWLSGGRRPNPRTDCKLAAHSTT